MDSAATSYRDPEPFGAEAHGLSFTFYPAGKDRRTALFEIIDGARQSLKLAFYIFAQDEVARATRDALVAAVRRGVEVTVIVDGFGSEADEEFFEEFIEAGGTFLVFLAKWTRRALVRNHQKIVVADEKVAMLGGFNIDDGYFAPPEENGWNDLGFRVEGPVVDRVSEWFGELVEWASDERSQFRDIRRRVRCWEGGEGPVQLLIGGPSRQLSSWAARVSDDLQRGERLDMIMAYFSPNKPLRKALWRIAREGEANFVLAAKTDNGATLGAHRALHGPLLDAGAKIWEFQPCRLHTKLIVLDDTVYLGSANFDMRSLYLNLEIVLRIEDAELAERMRSFIREHLPACEPITLELHAKRATLWTRAKWWASWFLVSVLDYSVSRKLNLGL
ncbi:phosphatidylserine/phosphatidylglycerophosphate/cardiolipin synthase family protein [Aurantiacibacter sp. MUD11]|uniref:phospholipase D-like domain-containing protein n=1 Tax=Aurantiacibacter sp. MUD11 TaxID=3003265 RepID=UPI0022AB1C27|nr:phosphatidylserine/phosphatidylglycerophosphate/cardiolipin synthase family protein [Aurantiacibacter sp. MUD11]WAT16810.1 phosphatidylserine/phosphatidylglycerophosphate/cardiolipin synthase family protein [Aurantiacibacter sp. MUD11]